MNSISRREGVLEACVSRTLKVLGNPSGKQLRELTLRLKELQTRLNQLKRERA